MKIMVKILVRGTTLENVTKISEQCYVIVTFEKTLRGLRTRRGSDCWCNKDFESRFRRSHSILVITSFFL